MYMTIDTQNHPPIYTRPYRHSPADKAEISRQVKEMLDAGIIKEDMSPWSSPVLLVRKKNGEARLVLDFRRLNSVTSLVSYPIPTFEEIIDNLADQRPALFSTLDLRAGYHQSKLNPQTADRTGFSTADGSYSFLRVPFGLSGAVVFFQKLMTSVLRNLSPSSCLVYLDDVICFGRDGPDMILKLQQIFDRFRENNLRIHPAKSVFSTARCTYLGHVISERGIEPDTSKFNIVRDYKPCRNVKSVRQYLGLLNFYKKFIKSFSQIAAPLRALLKKDTPSFGPQSVKQHSTN
jgi:hypothetical protein